MTEHCCETMTSNIDQRCDHHSDPFECPDNLIYFSAEGKKYGLIIHDGGSSIIEIQFCPWCGAKLESVEVGG